MIVSIFFILLSVLCLRGLMSDFRGWWGVILIGFTQDPVRKLISGEPVIMSVMVGLVVASIFLRQTVTAPSTLLDSFSKWSSQVNLAIFVFLVLVVFQGLHSLLRYGSVLLTGLGAVFYIAPLVAIVVSYAQFNRFEAVRHFMLVFSMLALIVALSVIYSYFGGQSQLLGEVGSGLIIYDQGTILKAYSGLMRSSEIASWHMGACVCFLVVLVIDRGSLPSFLIVVISVALLVGAIILTGRRKMILQIVVFSCIYFPLLRYYQQRLSSRFFALIVLGLVLFTGLYLAVLPGFQGTQYDLYLARGVSVFGDAGERFTSLGLGSISWAIRDHGIFGGGLGVAAQGAQHLAVGGTGGSGEGGIGKLVSELGLISLFIVAWMGIAIAKHLHKCMRLVATVVPEKLPFVVGILVFLLSNIPTFTVASQVYGDVFVLVILGFLAGALFAIPKHVVARVEYFRFRASN